MSSRPLLSPFQVISSGDMSTTLTSKVTVISNVSLLSYGCAWTGSSPVGTLSVQVSNEYSLNAAGDVQNSGTDWTELTNAAVSGNSGSAFFNLADIAAYAIRVVYTKTSGTGSLNVTVTGKVQ